MMCANKVHKERSHTKVSVVFLGMIYILIPDILERRCLFLTYSCQLDYALGDGGFSLSFCDELKTVSPTPLTISNMNLASCFTKISENVVTGSPLKLNHSSTRCCIPEQGCGPKLQCREIITVWIVNSNSCYSISRGQLRFTWMHLVLAFLP